MEKKIWQQVIKVQHDPPEVHEEISAEPKRMRKLHGQSGSRRSKGRSLDERWKAERALCYEMTGI